VVGRRLTTPAFTRIIAGVVVLTMLGTAGRLFLLTSQSLWYDEGSSLYYSGGVTLQDSLARLAQSSASERYQVLYFVLLWAWRHLFGNGEASLRMLSVVLGVGTLPIVFAISALARGTSTALVSLAVASVSAYMVYYSQEVRPYALGFVLASCQLLALLCCIKRPTRLRLALLALATAAHLLTSALAAVFTCSLALSHLLVYGSHRQWQRIWGPTLVASTPVLAWYVLSLASIPPGHRSISSLRQSILENAAFALYGVILGHTYGPPIEHLRGPDRLHNALAFWPQLGAAGTVALIISVLIVLALRCHKPWLSPSEKLLLGTLVFSFIASLILAVVLNFNLQPRHVYYVAITSLPLTASLITSVINMGRATRVLGTLGLVGLLALNGYSLHNYYFDPRYARDDYRAAATFLARQPGSTAGVLLWGSPELLSYYGAVNVLDGRALAKANLGEQLKALTNRAEVVFVVVNRPFYWFDGASVPDAVGKTYSLQSITRFQNFLIYHFTLADGSENN
jgi:4-amino-4-deoxy-L-arabinose transferase-like glycosyltransferase